MMIKNLINRRLTVFFLSPRVIDFDTYLPLALELSDRRPGLGIRFVTFSLANYRFITDNQTMMAGLARCGHLYYFGSESTVDAKGNSALRRFSRQALAFISICSWLVSHPGSVLFHGRQFSQFPYAAWYFINRCLGGKGYVLARSRLVDQGLHNMFRERFSEIKEAKSLLQRITGRDADGLFYYHDRQHLYLKSLGRYGFASGLVAEALGLPNLLPAWTALIEEQSTLELAALQADGHKIEEIYTVLVTKEFSSVALRRFDSVSVTFQLILEALLRNRADATILVRPHPLAVNEAYFLNTLESLGNRRIVVSMAHPEVLAAISRRLIVNAPTNIQFTTYGSRIIDCTDYKVEDLEERNGQSFAAGYNSLFVNPTSDDFEERFAAALEDDIWADETSMNGEFERLVTANPANITQLLAATEWKN